LNLLTMNQFFRTRLNPIQAAKFIESLGDRTIVEPQNFEEQALKMMGRDLYENFFYGYTKKQWGMEPSLLPASILQRLPMRFNYDDNYYNSRYQGIPIDGYTAIVEKILDHPAIKIKLKTKYDADMKYDFSHLFFSGPIDAFFDFKLGRLKYRTLKFESFDIDGDFQGNPVINYCEESVQHTRIAEHKHFAPWENHKRSVCFREYSSEMTPGTIPYYPVRLAEDKDLLSKYVGAARETPQVTFIGRLGTYRYLDMHVVIAETLETAKKCLTTSMQEWPVFSNPPLPGVVAGRTKQRAA
jgi:UDP-galactopyranose mutase